MDINSTSRGRGAKKNKEKRKRILFMISFLAIPIINFLIFYIYANLDSFLMAFQRPVYEGIKKTEMSFENFKQMYILFGSTGGRLKEAFINSMLFYLVGVFIILPISVLMSYFIYKKIKMFKAFRFIMFLPSIITSSALVVLFKYAIGEGGIMMALFKNWEYPMVLKPNAILTLLFYNISFGFGGNIIILNGTMSSINKEMLEAGRIDGCDWFKELIYVIIPSIWPTLSTILILGIAGMLGSTGPVLAFGQKGAFGTTTLSFFIYDLVAGVSGNQDLYLASAIGLVMTIISFPLAMIAKRLLYGKEEN